MRTGGATKIILCADHFYNKIIACFCAILRIYAPSLEGSKDAFRHELIVFQTSKLAEKAPIQRASCLGSRQDSDCTKNSHFQKMHEPLAGFCRPSFGKFPLKECASFQSIPFRASSPSTPFNPCELPKDGKECVSFLMDFVRLSALENRNYGGDFSDLNLCQKL